jgi:hypothetical protein
MVYLEDLLHCRRPRRIKNDYSVGKHIILVVEAGFLWNAFCYALSA